MFRFYFVKFCLNKIVPMRIVLLLLLVVSPTLTQQQFTTIPTSAYFIHPPKTTYPHSAAQLFTSQYPTYNSNSIIEFKPVVPQSIQTEGFGGFNLRNPISVRFEVSERFVGVNLNLIWTTARNGYIHYRTNPLNAFDSLHSFCSCFIENAPRTFFAWRSTIMFRTTCC